MTAFQQQKLLILLLFRSKYFLYNSFSTTNIVNSFSVTNLTQLIEQKRKKKVTNIINITAFQQQILLIAFQLVLQILLISQLSSSKYCQYNKIKTNKVKKERYLIKQDITIYKFSIKSLSSIGQNKLKLQKQIDKLLILTETAA